MSRLTTIIVFLLLAATLHAQKPGPVLKLSTANGQTTFHIGERIPIVFTFTGPDDESFAVSFFRINRESGLDDFSASPSTGTADPLALYTAYTGFGFSGQIATPKLSSKPVTRTANLNEWIRFDEPGTYEITDTTHRIGPAGKSGFFVIMNGLKIQSNRLQLHIIPATAAWQKATLKRILHDLAVPTKPNEEPSASREAAIEDLRYLATPEAIAALAANLTDDNPDIQWEALEGLAGLPRSLRDTALAAMNRLIDDPHFPVSSTFFDEMAFLQLDDLPIPDFEHFDEPRYRELSANFATKKQVFVDAAWQATATALPRKVEPALAATAHTLLDTQPRHPTATAVAQIGAVLRASFPKLAKPEQARLLQDQWDLIGSRELLPELRTLAQLSDEEQLNVWPDMARQPRAIALQRWYEFEPEAATREIRNQIGSANPSLTAGDIDYLPPQTLPQFEPIWAKAFTESDNFELSDTLGGLLIRFGTGAAVVQLLPQIRGTNADNSGNHSAKALAYVLRFDPQAARPFLTPALSPDSQCSGVGLRSIADLVQDPVLTEAALTSLQSPCRAAISDALEYLTAYGDESARQPILDAYLKWSERMAAKRAKPEDPIETPEDREDRAQRDLGNSFVYALLINQAWIPDQALIDTVLNHCIGKVMCETTAQLAKPDFDITVTDSPLWHEYQVGHFRCATLKLFEAKLDQFPAGTAFTITHSDSGYPGRQRQIEATIPALLEKHGMKLQPPVP